MALTLEQLKQRKFGIGGSDCAAILGISKWKTPLDVFFDKITEAEEELDELSPVIEWGNRLEPVLVKKFEEMTGKVCQIMPDIIKHPKYPFMLANVDAYIPAENAILECKTADRFVAKEWALEGGDNIPDYYLTQCAHYAEVMDVNIVYIAVLIGGNDFRIYTYNRTQKLHDIIIAAEKNFWENHVLAKIPPQPSNINDCNKLWQNATQGASKTSTQSIEQTILDLKAIKLKIKSLEEEYRQKNMNVFEYLQEAELLISESGQELATWKNQTTNRFDLEKFRVDYPDLQDKYIKQTVTRVLRLKNNDRL